MRESYVVTWMRNAAFGCLIAGGALLAGPGTVGCGVASADLLGIGIDDLPIIGDDDDDKDSGPPAARVGAGRAESEQEERGFGIAIAGVVGEARGDRGGPAPAAGGPDRSSSLPPVPTEPSARTVVIRAEPPALPAVAAPAIAPPLVAPPVVMPPIMPPVAAPAAPLAAMPPGPPSPPVGPPPSVIQQPSIDQEPAPAEALNGHAPGSFRAGYPEYLRAATIGGLVAAAAPGAAGLVVFTTAGGLLGYRQARAALTLPPANIARFLQ